MPVEAVFRFLLDGHHGFRNPPGKRLPRVDQARFVRQPIIDERPFPRFLGAQDRFELRPQLRCAAAVQAADGVGFLRFRHVRPPADEVIHRERLELRLAGVAPGKDVAYLETRILDGDGRAMRQARRREHQQERARLENPEQFGRNGREKLLKAPPLRPVEPHADRQPADRTRIPLRAVDAGLIPVVAQPVEKIGRIGHRKMHAVRVHAGQHVATIARNQPDLLRRSVRARVRRRKSRRPGCPGHGFPPQRPAVIRYIPDAPSSGRGRPRRPPSSLRRPRSRRGPRRSIADAPRSPRRKRRTRRATRRR